LILFNFSYDLGYWSSPFMRLVVRTFAGAADASWKAAREWCAAQGKAAQFVLVELFTCELVQFGAFCMGEFFERLVPVQEGRVAL